MTTLLPLLALALAAAGFFVFFARSKSDEPTSTPLPLTSVGLGVAFAAILAIVAFVKREDFDGALFGAIGLAAGAVAAILGHAASRWTHGRLGGPLVPMAIGVSAASFLHWLSPENVGNAQLGAAFGAFATAWLLVSREPGPSGGIQAAVYLAAVIAADQLGAAQNAAVSFGVAGTAFAVAGLAAVLIGALVSASAKGEKSSAMAVVTTMAILLIGGYAVGQRFLDIRDSWILFCGAALVGLLVHWLVPDDEPANLFRYLIAMVVWISIATIGFQLRQGFGMALALLGALTVLLAADNRRAILSVGPLIALVFYRLFREAHTDATRALDIGQHYALIGLALGAIVPLLIVDWRKLRVDGVVTGIGSLLWVVLLGAVASAIAMILGPKAVVGFLAGFGFCAALEGLRGGRSLVPLATAAGLAAWITLSYDWMGDALTRTRDEKIALLGTLAIVIALVVGAILLTSRKPVVSQQ